MEDIFIRSKFGIILFVMLNMISSGLRAQYIISEADHQFELYNYSEAAKLYLKAWGKKEKAYTARRLAESYQKMHNYKEAEAWYYRLSLISGSGPESKLWYADVLRSRGKYQEAKAQYLQYKEQSMKAIFPALQTRIASCDSALAWTAAPAHIDIENQVKLNSSASDWAAVKYNNSIVFASDRTSDLVTGSQKNKTFLRFDGARIPDRQTYKWTGKPYMHLYEYRAEQIGLLPLHATKQYHMGAVSFTAEGKEAFFSITSANNRKDFKQAINTIHVGLYSSNLVDGKWTDPVPFRYTDMNKWSVGDPCISSDGQTLYFVSDMPGGLGGTDIYRSIRQTDGKWSDAINLGAKINTRGNERSPAIYEDKLFFSSDGRIGMGGLDIYKSSLDDDDVGIINMGYPMNSAQDDFAIYFTGEHTGFVSSDRDGGAGQDDIYSFVIMAEKNTPGVPLPVLSAIKGDSVYRENIYYNFDRTAIRDDAKLVLHKIYSLLERDGDSQLVMASYTDSKGTEPYNLRLSGKRAEAAAAYFIEKGINRLRITSKGYGETNPAVSDVLKNGSDSPVERQLNRRTEIQVIFKRNQDK